MRSAYPDVEAMRRHHAEEWQRQIINAGGDENVALQAVTLAALNGLFDHLGVAQAAPVGLAIQQEMDRAVSYDRSMIPTTEVLGMLDRIAYACALPSTEGK